MKNGKINLTKFHSSKVIEHDGKRGVFIPIKDNHLTENRNNQVYVDVIAFPTTKLKPFDSNIIVSVPKEFRDGSFLIGGWRLED